MSQDPTLLAVYLHLARASRQRQRPHVTDRLLILAGVEAAKLDYGPLAAFCRQQVLQHNQHHLIGRWWTFPQALLDDEFLCLLRQLRRRYPQEKAERLLVNLGIDPALERQQHDSDLDYLAALLETTPDQLARQFPDAI
jgi:hypothetical protein